MSKSQEGQNEGVCMAGEADVTGLCKGQDNATWVWAPLFESQDSAF